MSPIKSSQTQIEFSSSTQNVIICKSSKAVSRIVDGQALILDVSRDEIRQLNEVGSLIWSMILKSQYTQDDIISEMIHAFEVEYELAVVDLNEFLESLDELGLIERVMRS